jgi:hypothetical protein
LVNDQLGSSCRGRLISVPNPGKRVEFNSAYKLRRMAVDYSIPILTNLQAADLKVKHWAEYE